MLMGCATQVALPQYNTPQWKALYHGGDGSGTDNAIIINSNDKKMIVEEENHYLNNMLTLKGNAYKVNNRTLYSLDNKAYDKIEIMLDNGTVQEYHFDISKPYGLAVQP